MDKIIRADELPQEEKVYLKKGLDGWRVVYPIKKEDGSMNWYSFFTGGNIWQLVKTLLVIAIILFVTWSYFHDINECKDLIENICDYQVRINQFCTPTFVDNQLTQLNLTGWEDVIQKET